MHEHLLPLATGLGVDELALALRRSAGWACNTLGNYYAAAPESTAQAVAAYSRGLDFDEANAMLLRNRASQQIEAGKYDAARSDIERAGQLEPEAARLPILWCELYATLGDAAALHRHAATLLDGDGQRQCEGHYFAAIAHALAGDEAAAQTAITQAQAGASAQQIKERLLTLERLQRLHPGAVARLTKLSGILTGGTADG